MAGGFLALRVFLSSCYPHGEQAIGQYLSIELHAVLLIMYLQVMDPESRAMLIDDNFVLARFAVY
jgi:hypothetical protein